jgi:hypothetical protein
MEIKMAYASQELKSKVAPVIKALCTKYGVKGSLSVRNHSTLVLTVKSGKLDFIDNFNKTVADRDPSGNRRIAAKGDIQVNVYHCQNHFTGKAKEFMVAAVAALRGPDYFDESDIMTDYFCCSHYVDINVGAWDKPYVVTA